MSRGEDRPPAGAADTFPRGGRRITSRWNTKLIGLYEKHGYAIVTEAEGMVRLAKDLSRVA